MLAHAPMEPLNATVHVTPQGCEVWIGTQVIARVQSSVAAALGLPLEKVTVHQHLLGGGFGRRLEPDMAVKAARIAQHVDGPVKVVYSREEDIRQDVYRPAYRDVISATLKDGRIAGWKHRIAGSSVVARWLPAAFKDGYDFDAVDSAVDMPYDIPNKLVEYVRCEPPGVVTGFWRGVGPNNNVFAIETFMDEMAHKAGKDPVDFRLGMLDGTPRLKAVVQQAAKLSGWGEALPARTGRGIAAQISFASFIATVCEAEVDGDGEVSLRRVVSVVDTGIAVNPDTVMAQLQGGLVFGLTAGLYGEITLEKGRVQQGNFNDYRMLRINQVPDIEVHVIKSSEPPGGIGETGSTASLPSLGNALFAATGIRLRRMPVDRDVLAGKKPA
jgi:isoquinoline 1-oxidoreductase beta subunit